MFLGSRYTGRHRSVSYLALARSLTVLGQHTAAETVMERYRLLDEAAFIVTEVKRSPAQLKRLVEVLNDLHRVAECGLQAVSRDCPRHRQRIRCLDKPTT